MEFDTDKAIMCGTIGRAVSDFVKRYGLNGVTVTARADEADAVFDSEGMLLGGRTVRVYLDIDDDDEDV